MQVAPYGVALSFEVTFDSPSLDVAMTVYDDSGGSPSLVATTAMVLVAGNTYRAKFTPTAGKSYVVIKSVYTDGTFTVLDTNYNAGSESFIATLPDITAEFVTVNTKLDAIAGYIDTEVAAIKAKTDNLPTDPADASDIAAAFVIVNGKLDVIDDYIDTEVAAIKAKTDNLPASPASTGDVTTAEAAIIAALPFGYKQNTAITGFQFRMYANDGSPATGLSPMVQVSKDGGSFAASSNAATELSLGWYIVDLTAGELNAKSVALNFSDAGAVSYGIVLTTET